MAKTQSERAANGGPARKSHDQKQERKAGERGQQGAEKKDSEKKDPKRVSGSKGRLAGW